MEHRIDFKEIMRLVNKTGFTEISPNPVAKSDGKWALFKGLNKVPGFNYPFEILYLYSDATKESIEEAASRLSITKTSQIVYAPSLNKFEFHIRSLFKAKARAVWSVKEYLSEFVKDKITNYIEIIQGKKPKYYIEPHIQTPSAYKVKHPNPLLSFFRDDNTTGRVAVLLAAPGQGKTYQAQYVASVLSESNLIPIYIHSQQWYTVRQEELKSLWTTILNCFRYFETAINWLDGAEEDFVRISLKAEIFCLIFDGFDEYILWNKGEVNAVDAIASIAELAKSTGAKILLTSRTSFWKSEVENKLDQATADNLILYDLIPFDTNQAKSYFDQRFSGDKTASKAAQDIFSELSKRYARDNAQNPVGRGFYLNLIADLVERTQGVKHTFERFESPSLWLVKALCEREETRQRLGLNAEQQIDLFKQFATLTLAGDPPSSATLRFILECEQDRFNLDPSEIESLVGDSGKLKDHPILHRKIDVDVWCFTEEQIKYNLLADTLHFYALNIEDVRYRKLLPSYVKDILSVSPSVAESVFLRAENLSSTLVDHVFYKYGVDAARPIVRKLIEALSDTPASISSNCTTLGPESLLVGSVALHAMNITKKPGSTTAERSDELLYYLSAGRRIKNVHFFGSMQGLDITEIEFSHCKFSNVTWSSCKFDQSTTFNHCYFAGGACHNCTGLGKSTWINLTADKAGSHFVSLECIREDAKRYTPNDLKQDINYIIRKLIPKEGVGFKSITSADILKGTISSSKHKKDILEGLCKHVLATHNISGTSSIGYHINEEARDAVLFFAVNGVYTGQLESAYQYIMKALKI